MALPPETPKEKNHPQTTEPKAKAIPRTPKLSDLMKGDTNSKAEKAEEKIVTPDEVFTPEQLQQVWNEFAEQRRKFQAEYQMLKEPYELRNGNQIIVTIHNPVQEDMLNGIRLDLCALLKERLRNNSIQLTGESAKESDQKKMFLGPKDRFEYMMKKNPALRELKERFGLDAEF